MDIEYYYGYVRNPDEIIENGFKERNYFKIVLMHENGEFKDYAGKAKFYIVNPNETIDWNHVFETNSLIVGYVGEKITEDEAKKFYLEVFNYNPNEYLSKFDKILNATLAHSVRGHMEYLEEEKKFIKEFKKDKK